MGRARVSTRAVVDTSGIFKWFVAYCEGGIDQAWDLLRSHQRGELSLAAPLSVLVEVANLLRYSGVGVGDAVALLGELERTHLVLFDVTPERARKALECAFENRITEYDALFLALAQELECPLVTADRRAFGRIDASVAQVQLVL